VNLSNRFDIGWLFFCGFSLQSLIFIYNIFTNQLNNADYLRVAYCIGMAGITFPKNKIPNRYIFIACGFFVGILIGIL
jgi:hypothetical protein